MLLGMVMSSIEMEPENFVMIGILILIILRIIVGILRSKKTKSGIGSEFLEKTTTYDYETIQRNMTVRTNAKVLKHEWVRKNDPRRHVHKNRGNYKYYDYILYEYEVNGRVWQVYGEDSGAFWNKNNTSIYYDPSNPGVSVTKYIHDKATGKDMIRNFLIFICFIVIIFACLFYFFIR